MSLSKGQAGQRYRSMGAVAAGLAAVAALSACGAISGGSKDSPTAASSQQSVKTVTYINPLPSYPDFNIIGKCAKSAAEKNGWKYNEVGVTGSSADNQASTDQISQAVAAGTDALVVVPVDIKSYTTAIKQARAKGVYVVAAGTGDPSTGQQSQAGTSGTELGKLEADSLGAKDPAAVVGFLSTSPDQHVQAEAINGFKQEAAEKFPKMTMSASQFDNGDPTKDVDVVSNMLTAHRDITALYVLNGTSLAPASTAVKEAGKQGKIQIIGHDVTDVSRDLIESGKIYGVVEQGWCDMGTKSVDAIRDLSAGKNVPAFVPTKITFVTKDNLPAK